MTMKRINILPNGFETFMAGMTRLEFHDSLLRRSELHSQRELQLTRIGCSIHAGSGGDGSILFNVSAGRAKVYVVEDVIRVHAELDGHDLPDREILLDSEIGIEEMGSEDAISTDISDLVKARRSKRSSKFLPLEVGQIMSGISGDMRLEGTRISIDIAWRRGWNTITA